MNYYISYLLGKEQLNFYEAGNIEEVVAKVKERETNYICTGDLVVGTVALIYFEYHDDILAEEFICYVEEIKIEKI